MKEVQYSAKYWRGGGKILTDTDSSNVWWKIFWRIVTIFHYTPVNAKQFDRLNIDGLAGKRQKRQNSPVKILCYTVIETIRIISCDDNQN